MHGRKRQATARQSRARLTGDKDRSSRGGGCGEASATPARRMQARRARRTSGKQTAKIEAGAAPERRGEARPASVGRRPGAAASVVG
ncbi:hypothetical protein U1Q18_014993 [Sarracenia purpurea var. burkii]